VPGRGVTRGGKAGAIPRAPNHCGGSRKVPTMSQVLSSTAYLLPKDIRFEHGGAKLAYCPGRHLTSLGPWCRVRVWPGLENEKQLRSKIKSNIFQCLQLVPYCSTLWVSDI